MTPLQFVQVHETLQKECCRVCCHIDMKFPPNPQPDLCAAIHKNVEILAQDTFAKIVPFFKEGKTSAEVEVTFLKAADDRGVKLIANLLSDKQIFCNTYVKSTTASNMTYGFQVSWSKDNPVLIEMERRSRTSSSMFL
jgi:hypothetical protein